MLQAVGLDWVRSQCVGTGLNSIGTGVPEVC